VPHLPHRMGGDGPQAIRRTHPATRRAVDLEENGVVDDSSEMGSCAAMGSNGVWVRRQSSHPEAALRHQCLPPTGLVVRPAKPDRWDPDPWRRPVGQMVSVPDGVPGDLWMCRCGRGWEIDVVSAVDGMPFHDDGEPFWRSSLSLTVWVRLVLLGRRVTGRG
jgi:hypothetical protein